MRRWLAAVGPAADDLLARATLLAGSEPEWAAVVRGIRARKEATSREGLALRGDDLALLGIPAGPEMGRLLERLLDAVIQDPSLNDREQLIALVRAWQ